VKKSEKTEEPKAAKPKQPKKSKDVAKSVGPEQYFFLSDGTPLKNLLELASALEDMTDEVFGHHVSEHKNDFAKWANDVFNDEELAIKMGHTKSKHQLQIVILKHLVRRLM
jgi:hypothetical protein